MGPSRVLTTLAPPEYVAFLLMTEHRAWGVAFHEGGARGWKQTHFSAAVMAVLYVWIDVTRVRVCNFGEGGMGWVVVG